MFNLSRIYIGNNNSNYKEILLKSNCKIKNIIMDPFGSNKMRYHYPSIFNFTIDMEDNEYKIKILRNNKNKDLRNSQYFPLNGWTNNLTITCILDNFELDNDFLINYIPLNYGKIEINNIIDKTSKYKVGLMIPTFGRLEYVKKCFESLNNCNLQDTLLIIIDESICKVYKDQPFYQDVTQDKIDTHEYIKQFNFNIPTIKIYKNKHGNMFDSINIGLDILSNICEYVMTMDSDTIHDPNFINIILKTYNELTTLYNDKLIILSGFNTNAHDYIDNNNDNDNFYIKKTIGGCHLCFKSQDYWNHIRYTLISYKWDTNIYNLVNSVNGIIAVTRPSVIEHIGEKSSVRNDNLGHVKSIDFRKQKKIYIISEDLILENNETWIIDIFKKEFIEYSNLLFVNTIDESDIIWIIGINMEKINYLKNIDLSNKIVITTIHHIDWNKIDNFNISFNILEQITNKYHVICEKVYHDLNKLTNKEIVIANFWINENIFYNIDSKNNLRNKYNIPINSFCVGSFQRDTEGKNKCLKPKLSKGPDIFINIANDLKNKNNNLLVILTGRRRNYIIQELEKNSINYLYFEMVNSSQLNELYNCLDLYIVSSRVEGGPRSILECGIAKIPIISTDVGIAKLILNKNSIYDFNIPLTYQNCNPDIIYAYNKANSYSINNYLNKFINIIFK
jgi:hypothetical protein